MRYTFKFKPELVWALIVAAVAALAQLTSGEPPEDWSTWLISAAAGIARALLAVIIANTGGSEHGE